MTEPLNHIMRAALPWQSGGLTECGRNVADFAIGIVLERAEAKTVIAKIGRTRSYMTMCVTCLDRGNYKVDSFEDNPALVMGRHCERAGYRPGLDAEINLELRAIALLVEAHREEFDEAITGMRAAVSMDELRAQRANRKPRVARGNGRSL